MNSKEKGDIAVAMALSYFTLQNNQILIPFGDKKPYDLVVEKDNKFLKIQCKYTSYKSKYGIFVVPLRVMGGNKSSNTIKKYKQGDFDLLYAYTSSGSQYVIPAYIWTKCTNSISLGDKYLEFLINPGI